MTKKETKLLETIKREINMRRVYKENMSHEPEISYGQGLLNGMQDAYNIIKANIKE